MTRTNKVQMERLDESNPSRLYRRYARQTRPQPCHIELDLESGRLSADWDPVVGSGVPARVYNRLVRRYPIRPLRTDHANTLLETIAPLAQIVLEHSRHHWRGGNYVGEVYGEGSDAEFEIERLCDDLRVDMEVTVCEADAFYEPLGADEVVASELGITAQTTDHDLSDIAQRQLADARREGVDWIDGLEGYLQHLRSTVATTSESDPRPMPSQ